MSNTIRKFIEFVNIIADKPGMFLINNVEDISLVIYGYKSACADYSNNFLDIDNFLNEFKKFINTHYDSNEDLDWARLIRFHCVNDSSTLDFFRYKFNEYASGFSD